MKMKKYLKIIGISLVLGLFGHGARAQYYAIANQLPNLITPALSGGLNYKGYVEASYLKGLGNKKLDIINVSTSQGFKYRDWLFMGVGIGVDVAMSHPNNNFVPTDRPNQFLNNGIKTGVMIPLFTDFRFNIGNQSKTSFYADLKLGASFLVGNRYLEVGDGYLSSQQYFYLKPSVGVRIPVNPKNSKQAFNVGVTYQLLTSNYWYNDWSRGITINALGVTAAYEW